MSTDVETLGLLDDDEIELDHAALALSELGVKVANEALEPIQSRINVAVEKILKPLVQGPERAYARLERQLVSNGRN